MANELLSTINTQLVALDRELGSSFLAGDVISAVAASVRSYSGGSSREVLLGELKRLYKLLLDCRPRMANVILEVQCMVLFLHKAGPEAGIDEFQQFIEQLRSERQARRQAMREVGVQTFESRRRPLLHTFGRQLADIIEFAGETGIVLDVTVADQEPTKTNKLIRFLKGTPHRFAVVSEFAISHVTADLDSALFGCLSVNACGDVIMPPGSNGIVSTLNQEGVPSFLVLPFSKFSFWEDDVQLAYEEQRLKHRGELEFEKRVFSHDVVPLELFERVITNQGMLTPEEAIGALKERQERFFGDERTFLECES